LNTAQGAVKRFSDSSSQQVGSLDASIGRLRASVLSLASAWAVFSAGKSIVNAGMQMQALQNRMIAATADAQVAAAAMSYVRDEADRLGLNLISAANGFASFSASAMRSGLTFEETKRIFTGVSEAATALQLSAERVDLVFQALGQMASKGQVSMEELRQQLGESLPGALQIFAKAMGVSTSQFIKMIENGQVGVDALRKLGDGLHNEFGERAVTAAQSAQAAFNRLGNALLDMKVKLAEGGFLDAVTDSARELTKLLTDPQVQEGLRNFATALGDIAGVALKVASQIGNLAMTVKAFIKDALGIKDAMKLSQADIAKILAPSGAQLASGLVGSGGAGAAATENSKYTLGKLSAPAGLGNTAIERAAKKAEDTRDRLRSRVSEMTAGLISESDPNKVQGAKAIADLEKQYESEQELLERALEKKAITQQEFAEHSLAIELDYESRMAALREQYRENFISDQQAAVEGFLGVQLSYHNRSVAEQGKSFRNSLAQAAEFNKTFFLLNKAAALAQATVSAYKSVVDAYAFGTAIGGPFLGAAFAATAAAAQAANIAHLASASFNGGSGISSSGGGGSAADASSGASGNGSGTSSSSAGQTNVYLTVESDKGGLWTDAGVRDLIDRINDVGKDGKQVIVHVQ
jgi:tape measure domain-containing protein